MTDRLANITDIYMPDVGTVEGPVFCGVCGTKMDVQRDCYGPTQMVMAIFGSKRHYDCFSCPHREEDWHRQVIDLRQEQKRTPSRAISDILDAEIKGILETRKPTKER